MDTIEPNCTDAKPALDAPSPSLEEIEKIRKLSKKNASIMFYIVLKDSVKETGKQFTKLTMVLPGLKPLSRFMNGKNYDPSASELNVTINNQRVTVDMTALPSGQRYHKEVTNRELGYPSIDEDKSDYKVTAGRLTVLAYQGR